MYAVLTIRYKYHHVVLLKEEHRCIVASNNFYRSSWTQFGLHFCFRYNLSLGNGFVVRWSSVFSSPAFVAFETEKYQ